MPAFITTALLTLGFRGAATRVPRAPTRREARRLDRLPTPAGGMPQAPFRSEGFAEDLLEAPRSH